MATCLPALCVGQETADVAQHQQGLQQADTGLNQAYQGVVGTLDPAGRASLKSTQRAWIVFKEADFGIFARLAHSAGDDAGLYDYEAKEDDFQTAALQSLGKSEAMAHGEFNSKLVTTSQEADQLLNSIYRQLMGLMPAETVLPEKTAEASWIRFRDLYCQLDSSLKGGNADDAVLRDLTLRRTAQLVQSINLLVGMKLPVPDSGNNPPADADETPTDPPPADPFRFAH
jgi:uncharacterized protein YecT (DUF1311 family)